MEEDWKQEKKEKKSRQDQAMKEQWRNMRRDEKLKVELGTTCEAVKKKEKVEKMLLN